MRSLRFIPILLAVAGLALWARSPATGADTKDAPARPPVDSLGMANAAKIYKTNCELCHGKSGNGDGPGAAGLNPRPRKFTDPSQFKSKDDNGVFNVITKGGAATGLSPAMPAWGSTLKREQIWLMVAYVRAFGAAKDTTKKH
jgi:mono/diheme cytochrome c family protein